jgi:hypothetical protein
MSTLQKRLSDLEERKAFHRFLEYEREFKGRSERELNFFAVHGFFPENGGEEPIPMCEFTMGGIRTIITTERGADDVG